VGVYNAPPPSFTAPPWRGGGSFHLEEEEEELKMGEGGAEKDTGRGAPNTRGVLSNTGNRRPATATSEREQNAAERNKTIARPHSSAGQRLPAVTNTNLAAFASRTILNAAASKFLGGGYKIPKEQASTQVVDELLHTFHRAISIPLVHEPDLEPAIIPDENDTAALQTRRLAGTG